MKMLRRRLGLLLAVTLTCAGTGPLALAQDQPPDAIQGDNDESSGMVVRIGRLESQIRALTGQIEQLQYQNKRLEDNLRKMQQDVDFRFQDLQGHGAPAAAPTATRPGPQKRSDADAGAPADQASAVSLPPDPAAAAPVPLKPTRSAGDAFDPDADPTAPGAPRTLGTTAPSAPLAARTPRQVATAEDSHAPLDLMRQMLPEATEASEG